MRRPIDLLSSQILLQARVEVGVLQFLNTRSDPDNAHHIVRMKDYFNFRNHLCLVFELLSVNLYELIKHNNFRGLSMNLLRVFISQVCLQAHSSIVLSGPPNSLVLIVRAWLSYFGGVSGDHAHHCVLIRLVKLPECLKGSVSAALVEVLGSTIMPLMLPQQRPTATGLPVEGI